MKEKLLTGSVARENLDHMLLKRPGFKDAVALAKIYVRSGNPILAEGHSYEKLEQFYQGIHNYSLRKNGPPVVVNTSNMPVEHQMYALFGISEVGFDRKRRGALLKANDGTPVIRVVDKLELPVQRYLPSAVRKKKSGLLDIENGSVQRVDTRVIACTSRGLRRMVNEGKFRKDLYYLLKTFRAVLPKAPEHRMDLEILLGEYYKKYPGRHTRHHALTPEVRGKILNFQWDSSDVQLESFCKCMTLTATGRKVPGEYAQDLLGSLYDLSEQEVKIPQTSSDRSFLEETRIKDIQDALM